MDNKKRRQPDPKVGAVILAILAVVCFATGALVPELRGLVFIAVVFVTVCTMLVILALRQRRAKRGSS
jgi:Flp pilus assembly protein TadB